jgi:hypothetical protein
VEGMPVVTSDDQKLGTVVGERDDCVIVESGHVFKANHAIPRSFVHEHEGTLRATVTKDVFDDSPKVDLDNWSCEQVLLHYGLDGPFEIAPDPDGAGNSAESDARRAGVVPAPEERLATLGGANDPSVEGPVIRDRMANAADPTGTTANLNDENRS